RGISIGVKPTLQRRVEGLYPLYLAALHRLSKRFAKARTFQFRKFLPQNFPDKGGRRAANDRRRLVVDVLDSPVTAEKEESFGHAVQNFLVLLLRFLSL